MTLIRTMLSIFFVLLCTIDVSAAKPHHALKAPAILIPTAWERYGREIKKFPEQLKQFNERVQKINDPAFYKDWRALNPSTGDTQKFSDLKPITKQVLYLYNAEVLEATLAKKDSEWMKIETYLQHYPSLILLPPDATDEQKEEAEKQEEKNKKSRKKLAEDVKKLRIKLQDTRTHLAIKRVQMVQSMIEKHKGEKFAEELKRYLEHTKKYYGKIGLEIEVPKKEEKK